MPEAEIDMTNIEQKSDNVNKNVEATQSVDEAQAAIDALRAWVEKAVPGQATAHYLAGIALQDLNKTPRGISFLKRSLHGEDLPEDLRIFVHYELACAYQSMEDMDEASYYLKRVVRNDPEFLDAKQRLERVTNAPQPA